MKFGKPGRPPEDRLARQQEIFAAVAPLLGPGRVRELTMSRAARAAHLSVGGLYHYFSSKRQLVLFGIDPANLQRVCTDFRIRHERLFETDPTALLTASLDLLAGAALRYVRPSALAAMELDLPAYRAAVEEVLTTELIGLLQIIRLAQPDITQRRADELNRALRRVCTLAFVDPTLTGMQLRAQLQATLNGAGDVHPSLAAVPPGHTST